MPRFTVIARPDSISEQVKGNIITTLNNNGYTYDDNNPETVFVVGGDGTFIYAVHYVTRKLGRQLSDVCFYGIHTGTLGFYTDYRDTDYEEFMYTFLSGKYREISYPLLQALFGDQKHNVINEVRIENAQKTQKIDVYFDGEFFETFRGSGLCVCTQLGSSALNKSLGGAIIQEGLDFIEMTEIAGIHHAKARSLNAPIILKRDTLIEFKSDSFEGAVLGCDADVYPLHDVHEIRIQVSKHAKVRMLRGRDVSYFDRLKSLF